MGITSLLSSDKKELTIGVQGRFDFGSLQAFRDAYEKVAPDPERYIVNLKEADYLDSSALGMLLALRDHAGGDTASIIIRDAIPDVKKILTITKLNELFKVE